MIPVLRVFSRSVPLTALAREPKKFTRREARMGMNPEGYPEPYRWHQCLLRRQTLDLLSFFEL